MLYGSVPFGQLFSPEQQAQEGWGRNETDFPIMFLTDFLISQIKAQNGRKSMVKLGEIQKHGNSSLGICNNSSFGLYPK